MTVLLPGATLGVMGGGQLGRMFVHAAQRMGYFTAVLDPDPGSPAGRVSHHHVQADYLDEIGLARLSGYADAITTEFENVPADALARLAQHRLVAPGAAAVAIAQDRAEEKAHFTRCGVPCAPHAVITNEEELAQVDDVLLPGILKTSRLGYDGKGQAGVRAGGERRAAWEGLKRAGCVLEKLLPLAFECSVVVARGRDGAMVHLPLQRNLHRDGILAVTEVHEACIERAQAQRAIASAQAIAKGLDYVGVLCVEFFGLQDGSLVVNEMAPRPHNSGHWSIEGADVSQFELQVRTLAGLPLVQPRQHSPAIMLNLLGDLWFRQGAQENPPDWAAVLALPGTHLHLYGKASPRPGRKMGHLTVTGSGIEAVRATALKAAQRLGIAAF
jgi:5-(carboxyamino)imidazole ribonucleotide synthase